jgi:hypothetical protein
MSLETLNDSPLVLEVKRLIQAAEQLAAIVSSHDQCQTLSGQQ